MNKIVANGNSININEEIYSTEETVIGTWIDGKPLYRKTYKFNSPSAIATASVEVTDLPKNAEVVEAVGIIKGSSSTMILPAPYIIPNNSDNYASLYAGLVFASGKIRMVVGHKNFTNSPVIATIKYTKTTDKVV